MTDPKIIAFIKEHHVLNLATCIDNSPYIASCFYAYNTEHNVFIFASDKQTKHVQQIEINSSVAAAITLETDVIGKIQGLQITGTAGLLKDAGLKKFYFSKYPFVIIKNTTLWYLEPVFMKLTDNRLGFGKKIIWQKNEIKKEG